MKKKIATQATGKTQSVHKAQKTSTPFYSCNHRYFHLYYVNDYRFTRGEKSYDARWWF